MAYHGHRLLPSFIDQIALETPKLSFVEVPKSANISEGSRKITYDVLARAVDKCAWWIQQELGQGHGFPALAYVGPHDLRYLFLVFGACKAGYKMFFASPRNSTAALLDLLAQVGCEIFLTPVDAPVYSNLLISVLAERPMTTLSFPDLEHFLDVGDDLKPYFWNRTFEEVKHDPLAVFHTSGSTGVPKLVTMNHGAVAALDAFRNIETRTGEQIQTNSYLGKRTLLLFPMFHASALSTLFLSIWNTIPTILPPPVPLTADLANDMLVNCSVEVSIMPPSILADMAASQEYLGNLCKCSSVMYGGGPLPTEAGHRIASRTSLITVFGASETGFFPVEVMEGMDWPYVKLSRCSGGVHRIYADGLYELVVERNSELEEYQPVFWMYPDLQEYHTKDLFSKHPTKPGLWLWQGRIDDIIVLSNGEKFNPISMEDMIINGHPAVESAIVAGQGRMQCALLVELSSTDSSEEDRSDKEVVEELWPAVQKANESCPEYGRLMKDMVIVAKQGKRMVRADKGTVQRKRTLERFAAELDQLYHLRDGPDAAYANFYRPMDLNSVKESIARIVRGIHRYETIQTNTNFFEIGLDSLHAITMARHIRTAFLNSSPPVTTKVVYDHPSIDLLASFVCGTVNGQEESIKTMQILYERYLPAHEETTPFDKSKLATVLLVGSTGHFGTQLMAQLLRSKEVGTIYCLNRDPDARSKQSGFTLHEDVIYSKNVKYLYADRSQPRFGLPEKHWFRLLNNVTHVIHNAWPVDFCMPLSHFEPSIRMTAELMQLCKSADCAPTFVFISSIGSVIGNDTPLVTEEVVHDWLAAENMGYTQSKLVAERLIATAATKKGVKSAICRVGQLGGVLNHEVWGDEVPHWPEKQWLPAMLASSIRLGAIPSSLASLNRVDWFPVDVAAATVCELVLATPATADICNVYNIVNPQLTTWDHLLSELKAYKDLERVTLADWVVLLKKNIDGGQVDVPAASLVEFFEGACESETQKPLVDCSKSMALSPTLRGTQAISVELMECWIRQWSFSG
ncbi:acetyl-CoA synthetase-like protein [Aureobasidium pullulans]|uniref:Acetyl-CoA synthetase-like protein n=1 Tax=Aureobasidium pullulans TaxID=5580 RepID=A0A4S8ZLR3_AURPU|nr:acetyl-CoA synthetase-like protein [Aureobasidium pullulans]